LIYVTVTDDYGTELARVRIENLSDGDPEWGRYSAEFAVERVGAIGLHRRSFIFKRLHGNVLGLLQVALSTLSIEELELENAPIGPSDLARRQRGVVGQIQGWPSKLRHN
jgi:hypothetical protein